MKHKWAKEIKAWADGAEIEYKNNDRKMCWTKCECPTFDTAGGWEYRIKPQPKEPQYLYVFWNKIDSYSGYAIKEDLYIYADKTRWELKGKIKLEQDDEPT